MRAPKNQRGGGTTSKAEKGELAAIKTLVLNELKDLGAYLYHHAQSGSIYIKFKDERLRSLRICNHGNIPKYRYKWNIELGGVTREEVDKGVRRFFFADNELQKFYSRIRQYAATIKHNEQQQSAASMYDEYGMYMAMNERNPQ